MKGFLLAELVHCGVTGSTDEDGAAVLLDQLVDDGGAGDGLAGAGRTLDQGERPLQSVLHRVHLKVGVSSTVT